MSTATAPLSSVKRQQYEQKLVAAAKQQQDELEKRKLANAEYARVTTEKLLKKYKEHKDAEDAKLANPDAYYVPAEPNFFLAIQIRSQWRVSPKPRNVLKLFRLKTINSAVIVRNNASTKPMLQTAKDYLAYGYLSYEMLRRLIYTRGYGMINNTKVPLTNETIEEAFDGKYRCIEELVYQIYFGSEDTKQILRFLAPFRLSCPRGGFRGKKSKKMSFLEGGATNNHHEMLGELLEKMI